jgi:hypothetical protein
MSSLTMNPSPESGLDWSTLVHALEAQRRCILAGGAGLEAADAELVHWLPQLQQLSSTAPIHPPHPMALQAKQLLQENQQLLRLSLYWVRNTLKHLMPSSPAEYTPTGTVKPQLNAPDPTTGVQA